MQIDHNRHIGTAGSEDVLRKSKLRAELEALEVAEAFGEYYYITPVNIDGSTYYFSLSSEGLEEPPPHAFKIVDWEGRSFTDPALNIVDGMEGALTLPQLELLCSMLNEAAQRCVRKMRDVYGVPTIYASGQEIAGEIESHGDSPHSD